MQHKQISTVRHSESECVCHSHCVNCVKYCIWKTLSDESSTQDPRPSSILLPGRRCAGWEIEHLMVKKEDCGRASTGGLATTTNSKNFNNLACANSNLTIEQFCRELASVGCLRATRITTAGMQTYWGFAIAVFCDRRTIHFIEAPSVGRSVPWPPTLRRPTALGWRNIAYTCWNWKAVADCDNWQRRDEWLA